MATVLFHGELRRLTGTERVEVNARNYRALVAELVERFEPVTDALLQRHALAIDGRVIAEPLVQTFETGSELVFVAKIAGG